MPKTIFIRKPSTLEEVQERSRSFAEKRGEKAFSDYYIAEEVQLEANEFFDLCENLMEVYDWIEWFSDHMYCSKDGAVAAMRVTCSQSAMVLIIDPQGFDYPRYVGLEEP